MVSLPPFKKRKLLVSDIDKLSTETQRLEAIYQQKLTALDEFIKQSIL